MKNLNSIVLLSLLFLPLLSCTKEDDARHSQDLGSGIFNGNNYSYGRGLTIDADGNIIFVGFSNSTDLSLDYSHIANSREDRKKADYDVIIGKYYIAEKRLVSAVIGGGEDDKGYAVAIGDKNRIYITGWTTSVDFPQTIDQRKAGQSTNIFISELSPDLSRLVSSRVISGNDYDFVRDIEIGADGSVYLAGSSASDDFPVKDGGFMTLLPKQGNSPWDIGLSGFVMKLSSDLKQIKAATFIGGDNGDDHLYDMAIAKNGDVYIIGNTDSASFPTTTEAFDPEYNGSVDIILARFDSTLSDLKASTYFGQQHYQYGRGIAINESGDVYAVGQANTRNKANPDYPGGAQYTFQGGFNDILLIRFDTALTTVVAITYLGGTNDEYATSVSLQEEDVYVTGYTASLNFPAQNGNREKLTAGTYDVFTVAVNDSLSEIKKSFRIGGRHNDFTYDALPDNNNNILFVGNSSSDYFSAKPSGRKQNMGLFLMSAPLDGFQ